MTRELIRRDSAWKATPYYVLVAAIVGPLLAPSHNRVAVLQFFLAFGCLIIHQAQVRATRLGAGLPIAACQLYLARFLAFALCLWLPAAAGAASILLFTAARAVAPVPLQMAGIGTLFLVALQSFRLKELSSPKWTWTVLYVPLWAGAWTAVATGYLAWASVACGLAAAALWLRIWLGLPASFELAPPPAVRGASSASRAAGSIGPTPALHWLAAVRTVCSWQYGFFLPQFFLGAMSGQWLPACFFVAMIWQLSRQRMRWLWNLPVNPGTVLPLFLAPPFALLAAGYWVGFHIGNHPRPIPEARVVILELAAMAGMVLLMVFFHVLFDWRRLRRIPARTRTAVLWMLVAVPTAAAVAWPLLDGRKSLARETVIRLAPLLPLSPPVLLALVLTLLAALYHFTCKIFKQAEYADKPRARVLDVEVWPG
jgi:hypothetical protein